MIFGGRGAEDLGGSSNPVASWALPLPQPCVPVLPGGFGTDGVSEGFDGALPLAC
jgi:hypothetical protein